MRWRSEPEYHAPLCYPGLSFHSARQRRRADSRPRGSDAWCRGHPIQHGGRTTLRRPRSRKSRLHFDFTASSCDYNPILSHCNPLQVATIIRGCDVVDYDNKTQLPRARFISAGHSGHCITRFCTRLNPTAYITALSFVRPSVERSTQVITACHKFIRLPGDRPHPPERDTNLTQQCSPAAASSSLHHLRVTIKRTTVGHCATRIRQLRPPDQSPKPPVAGVDDCLTGWMTSLWKVRGFW